MLAAAWPLGLLAGATWLLIAALLRMSSLAALLASAAAPIYALLPLALLGLPASAVAGTLWCRVCVCVCVPVLRMSRAARGPREVWAVSRPERSRYGRVGPRRLRDATRERPSGSGLFIVIGPGPSLRLRPQLCSQRAVSTTP